MRVLFSTHLEQIVPGLWEDTKGSEWVWVMAQWVKGNYEDLSLNPWCSYKDTDVVMDTCGDGIINRRQRQEDLWGLLARQSS